ncbi:hypothetical protein L9F63_009502, partial [Diploptera punctata]
MQNTRYAFFEMTQYMKFRNKIKTVNPQTTDYFSVFSTFGNINLHEYLTCPRWSQKWVLKKHKLSNYKLP